MSNVKVKVDSEDLNRLVQNLKISEYTNKVLVQKFTKINEKVDFYLSLGIDDDYHKGFNKAFEIVKNLLKGAD